MRVVGKRIGLCALILAMSWPAAATGKGFTVRVVSNAGFAPSDVVIQVFIEPDSRNKALSFEVDSEDFYTSSTVVLDGAQAPRTKQVTFRRVPAGSYDVRVTLIGTDGERGCIVNELELW